MTPVRLNLNDVSTEADVEPRTSLADFLRHGRHLTGTHIGCEHGVCGACTVLIDGVPARSCIAYAVALQDSEVRTIEGFDGDIVMAALRKAFHEEHALQCGYCTPGMLITARDILTRFAVLDESQIRIELAGNLCRCTGYMGIVSAITRVFREMPAELRGCKPATMPMTPVAPPVVAAATATLLPASAAPLGAAMPDKGTTRIMEQFMVERPPAEVWQLFADVPRLARCMPGAQLDSVDDGVLKGTFCVAFGPIKANFLGTATYERDDAAKTGRLSGGGGDERGGSRARGHMTYRLSEHAGGSATRVNLTLDYVIQGPLAQFSRSGLVREFASHLIAEFARNLGRSLDSNATVEPAPQAQLSVFSTFWSIAWARIKQRFVRRS